MLFLILYFISKLWPEHVFLLTFEQLRALDVKSAYGVEGTHACVYTHTHACTNKADWLCIWLCGLRQGSEPVRTSVPMTTKWGLEFHGPRWLWEFN